jgi:hypothetical protein
MESRDGGAGIAEMRQGEARIHQIERLARGRGTDVELLEGDVPHRLLRGFRSCEFKLRAIDVDAQHVAARSNSARQFEGDVATAAPASRQDHPSSIPRRSSSADVVG